MGSFAQDLKYGIRNLARHPGFAAAAMATLALGIAANTTVFSMVDAILLESLPYTDPGRLVSVYETDGRGNASPLSAPDFVDWTSSNHVFDGTAAVAFGGGGTITGTDQPERVLGVFVSPEFFPLLGVAPALGHGFADKDEANAVILSYSVWQRRFAGDPDIVGKKVTLSDAGCTVAGVLPREFYFLNRRIELWRPLHFTADQLRHRDQRFLTVTARLKPGVTSGQAQRELLLLAQRSDKTRSARVVSLRDDLVQGIRRTLLLLFGAVAFVLLIAVANIANLLLARAASREKEFAIRAALGAGRARIIRQLLTESMLVAGCGCVMGILLAAWGVRFLVAVVPNEYRVAIVGSDRIGIHGAVLAFSAGLSVLTALLSGLAPALILAARNPQSSLKIGRVESHGRGGRRLHSVLVVSEVALTLVLLIGAALLIQSFSRLQGVNPGYSRDNILTMRVFLADSRYPKPAQQVAFFEQVLRRIESLPGVETASVVNYLPVDSNLRHFTIEGRPASPRRAGSQ